MSNVKVSPIDKSLVLIGFMGVGKTTIGEVVAKKLGRTFVDVDSEIEKEFNMSVPEIFESFGQETFRKVEQRLTLKYCSEPGKVISLGGGAFLNEDIRNACLANCIVFYLDLSWDTWEKDRYQKISDSRPMLQGLTSEQIKELFNLRKPIYAIHHHKFPLDRFDAHQAADLIVDSVYEQILNYIKSDFELS